jgi:peptidoglycan/LPS O-acetylase OafA/YrhL
LFARLDGDDARPFRHLPALDGVRAIAIGFVVLLHYSSPWRHGASGIFRGGFIGVDVFFVLSGFLITSLLVNERARRGSASLGAFYARRALRLLPALLVLLAAHAVFIWSTTGEMATEVKSIFAVVFYVSNILQANGYEKLTNSGLTFTWSLSIEEQFYLVWPAVLLFVALRYASTRRALLGALVVAALASAALRMVSWFVVGSYNAAYFRTDGRVDGLLIGATAAFLWRWRMVPLKYLNVAASASLVVLVVAACFAAKPNNFMFSIGFTGVSVAAALIILAIAEGQWSLSPLFASAPMRVIGRVSYGIYLWHGLSLRLALKWIELDYGRTGLVSLGLLITAITVTASWYLVEQPALRVKARFAR